MTTTTAYDVASGAKPLIGFDTTITEGPLALLAPLPVGATPRGVGDVTAMVLAPRGGSAPYAVSLVSGALPAGRSLAAATLSGTYTTPGLFNYTFLVSDAAAQTVTLTVRERIVTRKALPGLPFLAGAKVGALGDSIHHYNSASSSPADATNIFGGAFGIVENAVAIDPRFNFDWWYDPTDPLGRGIGGAMQGMGGDHMDWDRPEFGYGILNRVPFMVARTPDIICIHAGTNSISSGDGGGIATQMAPYVIGRLDELLKLAYAAGVWTVLWTILPRADWPAGDFRHAERRAVNVWIRAQAARAGVKVLDLEPFFVSPTDPDGIVVANYQPDKVHPNAQGAIIGGQQMSALLATMISAGSVFNQDPTATNLVPDAAARMTGALTNGVPAGWQVAQSRGTSTWVAATEDRGAYKTLSVTITPVNDAAGTAYHQTDFNLTTPATANLPAEGEWVQGYLHCDMNDALSASIARLLIQVRQVSTNRSLSMALSESSGSFAAPTKGRGGFWFVTKPFRMPAGGYDRINAQLQIFYPKAMASPFTVKADRLIIRKITDPRIAWNTGA